VNARQPLSAVSFVANMLLPGDCLRQPQDADVSIRNLVIRILAAFLGNHSSTLTADSRSFPTPRAPQAFPFGSSGKDDRFADNFPAGELDIRWGRQAMDLGSRL
jgi:hypothetical protein